MEGQSEALRAFREANEGQLFEMGETDFDIAYIVSQYPKVSHSFIRREILALEAHLDGSYTPAR